MDSIKSGKYKLLPSQKNVSISFVKLTDAFEKALEKLVLDHPDKQKVTVTFSNDKKTLIVPSSTCSPPYVFNLEIQDKNGQDYVDLINFMGRNKMYVMGPINNSKINIKATIGNYNAIRKKQNQTKFLSEIPTQSCQTGPSQTKRPKMSHESSCKAKDTAHPALKPKKSEVNRGTELPKSDSQGKVNKVSVGVLTTATATESASSGAGYLETCSFRDVKAPKKRISRCQQQHSGRGREEAAEGVQQAVEFEQKVQKRLRKYSKVTNDKQKAEYKAVFKRKYKKYLELYESVTNFNLAQNCVQPNESQKKAIDKYNLLHEEMKCIKKLIKEYEDLDKFEDESVDEYENELCF